MTHNQYLQLIFKAIKVYDLKSIAYLNELIRITKTKVL